MSKSKLPSEFAFQLIALLTAVIIVHGFYVGLIRPSADAQLTIQAALQASGEAFVPERSLFVVIRDFEQEACFILMIWALAIMGPQSLDDASGSRHARQKPDRGHHGDHGPPAGCA